jgi:hypothetical protein
MNWREWITDSYAARPSPPGIAAKAEYFTAASVEAIARAEEALGVRFPVSHRDLLLETDGVMELLAIDGGDWLESMWVLWTIDEIVQDNLRIRAATSQQIPPGHFDSLLFVAGAGVDGILFGFPVENGHCLPRVVAWRPAGPVVQDLAPSLDEFLRGWLTGKITV